jgi:hypothetical protein
MTYAGTCFLRSERKPTERQLIALQEHWRDRVGLLALRDTLGTVLRNVEAAQVLLGKAKRGKKSKVLRDSNLPRQPEIRIR